MVYSAAVLGTTEDIPWGPVSRGFTVTARPTASSFLPEEKTGWKTWP
jgi:hypothetical protein